MNWIFIEFIITGFYSGYLLKAPGTWGSWLAVCIYSILYISLDIDHPSVLSIYLTVVSFILGYFCIVRFFQYDTSVEKDPAYIVIDEWIGIFISYLFVPFTIYNILIGFFIFRLLDIMKPWPASFFDKQSNTLGIILDDFIAGLYTSLILYGLNIFL